MARDLPEAFRRERPASKRGTRAPGCLDDSREAYNVIVVALMVAFAITAVCAGWIVSRAGSRWLADHPNERSLHDRPVSRAGGIAIFAGLVAGLGIVALVEAPVPGGGWMLAGALIVVSVSFADDLRRVSPAIRIVFHVAAAVCVVLAGLSSERIVLPGAALDLGAAAGALFTVLFVAWMVNLYNFMDGMDGFAGGMTAIGFTTLAVLCVRQDAGLLSAAGLVVASASLGFLPFNFPPARIFMGDLGSSLLGYLCAVVALSAERSASVPLWISVLVFSPFIVDASVTLARRTVAGERPWRAHRSHFYQRLVRIGWSHRKTVVREYGLMLACAASAVLALWVPGVQAAVLGVWVVVYVVLMLGVTSLEKHAGGSGR